MYKIIGADGREYGPVSAVEVIQWVREGRAAATTKVQPAGSTEWKNLSEIPELATALAGGAPPPPLPAALPPLAAPAPAAPVDPKAEAERIIAGGVNFSIGDCLGRGWNLVMADFWPVVGISALIWLILFATNMVYIGLLLIGPLLGGLYYYFLKKIRGQPATLNDAFAGFSLAFVQLFLVYLVSTLLTSIGMLACLIPGIYLAIAWYFVYALVIDRRMEFWTAMEVSRQVVNKVWWQVFAFALLVGLINLLGMLLLCVGFFITAPVTMAATAYAYESLFNRSSPASA